QVAALPQATFGKAAQRPNRRHAAVKSEQHGGTAFARVLWHHDHGLASPAQNAIARLAIAVLGFESEVDVAPEHREVMLLDFSDDELGGATAELERPGRDATITTAFQENALPCLRLLASIREQRLIAFLLEARPTDAGHRTGTNVRFV